MSFFRTVVGAVLWAAVAAVSTKVSLPICPDSTWTPGPENCYKVVEKSGNFLYADCESSAAKGSRLVTILSCEEQGIINELVSRKPSDEWGAWIGLSCQRTTPDPLTDPVWVWSDGHVYSRDVFDNGLDGKYGCNGQTELCATINSAGEWHTAQFYFGFVQAFICQLPRKKRTYEHVGCLDGTVDGAVRIKWTRIPIPPSQTGVSLCASSCGQKGFALAGLLAGHECWCTNNITGNLTNSGDGGAMVSAEAFDGCDVECAAGDSAPQMCGGMRHLSIYATHGFTLTDLPLPPPIHLHNANNTTTATALETTTQHLEPMTTEEAKETHHAGLRDSLLAVIVMCKAGLLFVLGSCFMAVLLIYFRCKKNKRTSLKQAAQDSCDDDEEWDSVYVMVPPPSYAAVAGEKTSQEQPPPAYAEVVMFQDTGVHCQPTL